MGVKIYQRKGTILIWLVKKKLVLELRLPIYIWRTQLKKEVKENEKEERKEKESRRTKRT